MNDPVAAPLADAADPAAGAATRANAAPACPPGEIPFLWKLKCELEAAYADRRNFADPYDWQRKWHKILSVVDPHGNADEQADHDRGFLGD